MAFLYHIKPDHQAECWLVDNKPMVVGRGDSADAYVEDDALSRSHFLIVREDEDYYIVDLHSSNGTWVDGELICASKLHSQQVIIAGESPFFFSCSAVPADNLPNALPLPKDANAPHDRLQAA
jgi:pSer/pThr/pTyr-binding forkhead associated (FHA) protein